jgi:hypothetical protein
VVELGVIQAVEQMHGARPRGREAHADLAGDLGVRGGGERRDLLVAHLDEVEVVADQRGTRRGSR